MRFLLINPFYPIDENPSPPLGLAYLAAALERAGVEVRILDLVVRPYTPELLEALLSDFRPDAAGVTAVTMTVDHALGVLADLKAIAPDLPTVIGGPHVSFQAEETLRLAPAVDYVVVGEGEETVVELARAIEAGADFESIPGLAYRRNNGIHQTDPRPPGIDVDTLAPPARHLLPLGRYRALGMAISMTTSRGCPFQCIFCVGRRMVGAKVRYRDPISVVDEMAVLAGYGFHQINIADDLFTANKRHCLEVCDEILRRGLRVKWTSFARVDTVSPEVLVAMKRAGCGAVSFGVETGDPEIMKTIRKGITLGQVIEAVEMCNRAGIIPHASFILGLPGETPDTLARTIAFGEKLKKLGVSHGFHLLAPFPGTRVRDEAQGYGLKILTDDWRRYHANRSVVETDTVSAQAMDEVVETWEREFDAYLGHIKEKMESAQATDEEAWPLVNLERIVLIYDLMMKRFMEERGAWEDSDGDDPLERLIIAAAGWSGKPMDLVRSALVAAVEHENLRCRRADGRVVWEWADQL